jgi:chromosomal replication initiation ATPase DnaA
MRQLQSELTDFALEAWIRPLVICEDGDRLRLLAPGPFHKKRVEVRFLARIREVAESQANGPLDIAVDLLP